MAAAPAADEPELDEQLVATEHVRRRGPAVTAVAVLVATVTFLVVVTTPAEKGYDPHVYAHAGSGEASPPSPPSPMPPLLLASAGAQAPTPAERAVLGSTLDADHAVADPDAEAGADNGTRSAPPLDATEDAAAAGENGTQRAPVPRLGASAPRFVGAERDAALEDAPRAPVQLGARAPAPLGRGQRRQPQSLACDVCAAACAKMSTRFCCSSGCMARCPYTMHSAGCELPADDDWRRTTGDAGACALDAMCAPRGACTVHNSSHPVHSSRALVRMIDHVCGSQADAAVNKSGAGGATEPVRTACAAARSDDSRGCSLIERADLVLCAAGAARHGLCCNALDEEGAPTCVYPLVAKAKWALLAAGVALSAVLVGAAALFGRVAVCWGRALLSAERRPYALAACAVCCGCYAWSRLKQCVADAGCCARGAYARRGKTRARGARDDWYATPGLHSARRDARELVAAERGEGAAAAALGGVFAAVSLVVWNLQYELFSSMRGAGAAGVCAQSCGDVLGEESCDALNVSAVATLCAASAVPAPPGAEAGAVAVPRTALPRLESPFACACAHVPLYRCVESNATLTLLRSDASRGLFSAVSHVLPGAPTPAGAWRLSTGECALDRAHVLWAGAIALGALVAGVWLLAALSRLACAGRGCALGRERNTDAAMRTRAPGQRRRGLPPSSAPPPVAPGDSCGPTAGTCDPLLLARPRPLDCESGAAGRAAGRQCGAALNVLLLPLLLPYNAIAAYLLPCVGAYARRLNSALIRLLCAPCARVWPHCCLFSFSDPEFPPTAASLGQRMSGSTSSARGGVDPQAIAWRRASELALLAAPFASEGKNRRAEWTRACLFHEGPDPADVDQGMLGDCWLMSSFACAAEVPGLIQSLFLTREANARGKYIVRLFDANARRWVRVVVDEFVPSDGRGPLYAQPGGNEMWVMLLEKAFAKLCGSYAALDGGHTGWGLQALTGDHVFSLVRRGGPEWERLNMSNAGTAADVRAVRHTFSGEKFDGAELWPLLLQYHRKGAMIGASTGSEAYANLGVISRHAYSVLRMAALTADNGVPLQLVLMRNPHGRSPWTGQWSARSAEWERNPSVAARLLPAGAKRPADDEGTFWMVWSDFTRVWDTIDLCDRSSGVRELALDFNEEDGCLGPTMGCALGCAWYWCAGAGCSVLYCKHTSSSETAELEGWPVRWLRDVRHGCAGYANACSHACS